MYGEGVAAKCECSVARVVIFAGGAGEKSWDKGAG